MIQHKREVISAMLQGNRIQAKQLLQNEHIRDMLNIPNGLKVSFETNPNDKGLFHFRGRPYTREEYEKVLRWVLENETIEIKDWLTEEVRTIPQNPANIEEIITKAIQGKSLFDCAITTRQQLDGRRNRKLWR